MYLCMYVPPLQVLAAVALLSSLLLLYVTLTSWNADNIFQT